MYAAWVGVLVGGCVAGRGVTTQPALSSCRPAHTHKHPGLGRQRPRERLPLVLSESVREGLTFLPYIRRVDVCICECSFVVHVVIVRIVSNDENKM